MLQQICLSLSIWCLFRNKVEKLCQNKISKVTIHQIFAVCNLVVMTYLFGHKTEHFDIKHDAIFESKSHSKMLYLMQMVHHMQGTMYQPNDGIGVSIWIHHITTLVLIIGSWCIGAHTIGGYVMYIHDVSDIFLYMLRISKQVIPNNVKLLVCIIPMTLISWIYYRQYHLGRLIYGIYKHTAAKEKYTYGPLLGVLFVLHSFWLWKMLRKIKIFFKKKE